MSWAQRINDHAVSPVIGVMLMIVVTIIIAAVVSAFAGGFAESQQKVPVAQFDLRLYSSLPIEKSEGATTFTGPNGNSYKTYQGHPMFMVIMKSGEPLPTKDLKLVTYYTTSNGTLMKNEFSSTGSSYLSWIVPGREQNWGLDNCIIHPGEEYRALGTNAVNKVLGEGVSSLPVGSKIEVDIVHMPTNSIIYHQDVMMQ
jgi:archaeal type IV pilus assembly protein PilA